MGKKKKVVKKHPITSLGIYTTVELAFTNPNIFFRVSDLPQGKNLCLLDLLLDLFPQFQLEESSKANKRIKIRHRMHLGLWIRSNLAPHGTQALQESWPTNESLTKKPVKNLRKRRPGESLSAKSKEEGPLSSKSLRTCTLNYLPSCPPILVVFAMLGGWVLWCTSK